MNHPDTNSVTDAAQLKADIVLLIDLITEHSRKVELVTHEDLQDEFLSKAPLQQPIPVSQIKAEYEAIPEMERKLRNKADDSPEEKEHIWDALLINYRPENRVYRYNFFFDNCATRPAAILEKEINGSVDYQYPYQSQTFRDLINYCTRNHPWLTFGCDLALGSPTDREATQHEMLFLPPYLKEAFSKATITGPDGTIRPLVSETHVIGAGEADEPEKDIWDLFTPLVCAWLLFGIVLGLTWIEWRKKKYFLWVDCVLFSVAGAGGVILFFLSFISVHPCTWPNWSLVWLQPLDLIAVILFCVKKLKKAAYYYHFINFAALTLMLLGWHFIPQHLNSAFIPLVASIWVRSGWGVYRKIWRIG